MSVLNRAALEGSTLADLHEIADELGIDGFRRLRKADLIGRILEHQGAEDEGPSPEAEVEETDAEETETDAEEAETEAAEEERPARRSRRGGRGGRGRSRERERDRDRDRDDDTGDDDEDRTVEGVVELLGNGSGFVRVSPPDPSDDDVYVSAAQVRRCELVSGDKVSGPVRSPRRSERYPSLVRVDTINGSPADEVAEGTPFDELAAAYPTQRFALGSDDATLKAIEWLTPIGKGSRVTVTGGPRAGKTEALRRLAGALAAQDGLEVSVVLAGARPEEVTQWRTSPPAEGLEPSATTTFAASPDAQGQAVDRTLETAKRVAARGGDAVVIIDSLDDLHRPAARKALSAARDIPDGGSLTVIAASSEQVGGETTVIALDAALTSTGRFPAVDLVASGTLHPGLLVGEAGADAIAQARAAAIG